MGNDLDYQFMCDYELHLISYKGKIVLDSEDIKKIFLKESIVYTMLEVVLAN